MMLMRQLIAALALGATLAVTGGCGSDEKSDPADAPAAKSQDAQAKSDVRNLVSTVESCYADQQTYESCRTAQSLGDTGLKLGPGPGQVEVATATAESYEVVGHSRSGNDFKIVKQPGGALERRCTAPDKGGCPAGGVW
jgi:type IV pilus assembly protein PilA